MKFYYYTLEKQTESENAKTVGVSKKESIASLVKEIQEVYRGQAPLITFFKEITEKEAIELMDIWQP